MAISAVPQEFSVLLKQAETLAPAQVKEWVQTLTGQQLDELMVKMDADRAVPDVFKSADVMAVLEARMEQLGVSRDKLTALRTQVEETAGGVGQKAEDAFKAELFKKGGGLVVLGTVAISILSWLGFKKFKKLKDSLTGKGFLRTAAESAIEHPIFAGFLAMAGIRVGTDLYAYLSGNKTAIERFIKDKAQKDGEPVEQTTKTLADKVRSASRNVADTGIQGAVNTVLYVLGGEVDEETGAITLRSPFSGEIISLHPPVVTAFRSGVRKNGERFIAKGVSTLLIENKLTAFLKETQRAGKALDTISQGKLELTKRAKELLTEVNTGRRSPSDPELAKILNTLDGELKLSGARTIDVDIDRATLEAELDDSVKRFEQGFADDKRRFEQSRGDIENRCVQAESDIASGRVKDIEAKKRETADFANTKAKEFTDATRNRSTAEAEKIAGIMSALTDPQTPGGTSKLEDVTRHTLDMKTSSKTQQRVQGVAKTMEKYGGKLLFSGPGKILVGGITCYSILPLGLEALSMGKSGKEGEAAKKALINDVHDTVGGFLPVYGEYLDIKQAILGKDSNGRDLTQADRITSAAFGALGTLSLAAGVFTGGASIAAFRVMRGAISFIKGAKTAMRAAKGARVAGLTAKGIDTMKTIAKVENAADSLKDLERLGKGFEVAKYQKVARVIKQGADTTMYGMQIGTYMHLGLSIASGFSTYAQNAQETIQRGAESIGTFGEKTADAIEGLS